MNTGNTPTTIEFQVLDLPAGWDAKGEMGVVLGVGEVRGIPIELVPEEGWSGDGGIVRIVAEDSMGNQREVSLGTQFSEYSWESSPYIFAHQGDDALIRVHGTGQGSHVVDDVSGESLKWSEMGWLLPVGSSTNGSLTIGGSVSLGYTLSSSESEARSAICSIAGGFEDVRASCSISNGSYDFEFQVLLIGDDGRVLDSIFGSLGENESAQSINLSGAEWDPDPGERRISIRLLDGKGGLVTDFERTFEVRRSDWNVGIGAVELVGEGEGQQINVPTKRLNENVLIGADCIITMSAGSHYSEHLVDMTQAFVPAPKFDRPDVEDGVELVVTIGCSFPWDIDSDPNDDESRLVLSGGSSLEDNFDEFGTGLLAAFLVVGLYLGLSWIVSNRREGKRLMSLAQAAIDEKMAEREAERSQEQGKSGSDESEEAPEGSPEDGGEDEVEPIQPEPEDGDEYDQRLRRLLDR